MVRLVRWPSGPAVILTRTGGNGSSGATLDQLVPQVYADTAAALHPVARRSLHAHLIRLAGQGRATQDGERWVAAG